jgi:hypothetical protein
MAEPIGSSSSAPVVAAPKNMVMREAIHIAVEEACKLSFEADGTLQQMQINGHVNLLVTDQSQASCKIRVAHSAGSEFQFKTHPKLAKDAFFSSAEPWLALGKGGGFPCDSVQSILKWRYSNTDEDKAPLKVTCWPSDLRGKTVCNLEYELGEVIQELQDVVISIPVPSHCEVAEVSGEAQYDSRNGVLLWRLDTIDASNSTGALEFSLSSVSHDMFFPINVKFTAPQTYCNMQVLGVVNTETNGNLKFSKETALKVEDFVIGEAD